MKNPKYTILVPTFERANLLRETIEGYLLQEYENYEIVISNNFSCDGTEKILDQYVTHPKIRIVNTEKKLSMQDHWGFAIEHVKGDYVLLLGDDDGIDPGLFSIIDDVIEKTKTNIIKYRTGLYFHNDWLGAEKNTFHFASNATGTFFEVNINDVINSFCELKDYKYFPSLLTCIFKRELYLSASKKVSRMFVGSPDHSCAFLMLAQEESKLCFVDMVLGFGGRSENSNASFYAAKENKHSKKHTRHDEWSTEMTEENRLPHHKPDINAPSNYISAAFSYAKFYFPDRLSRFSLNSFELCKVIQIDLTNCEIGRRSKWHTEKEELNFKEFMISNLSKDEQKQVFALGSKQSLNGRLYLFSKKIYFKINEILFLLGICNLELNKVRKAERRSYDKRVELNSYGINNSHELVKNLRRLTASNNLTEKII
jgi:glycosyltransferase involved in cell wall biosynthesis